MGAGSVSLAAPSPPAEPARPTEQALPRRLAARFARFSAWLAAFLVGVVSLAVLGLLTTLEQTPLVKRGETIAPTAIAEARRLLALNDPRRLRRGEKRTAEIPAALVDEAVNYVVSRSLGGRGAFVMAEDSAEVRLTVPARLPGAHYLNLRAVFREAEGEPRVAAAAIGAASVAPFLAESFIAVVLRIAGIGEQWRLARRAIRQMVFEPSRAVVLVTYVWEPKLLERAVSLAIADDDIARMRAVQRDLAGLLDHHAPYAKIPLVQVLTPLLAQAEERTSAHRRVVLLVLATYLAEKDLATILPQARQWPRVRRVKLTLGERHDSAQHFLVSAALVAWAGEPVTKAIGLYKELDDSRSGSGFSFADLAADMAGARFGELVVKDSPLLSEALQRTLTDTDLAPRLADLPEHLSEAQFGRVFGGVNGRGYQQLTGEIERRLDELPLYR